MYLLKNLKLFVVVSLFSLFFTGCIHQVNKQGLTMSLSSNQLSQSFESSFPLKKDFVFGSISINSPKILIHKDSKRINAGIDLDFKTMFTQKIAGNFSISGKPLFNKQSKSIFLHNVKIENLKFENLKLGDAFSKTFLNSLNPMVNKIFKKYQIYKIPKESFQGSFVKDVKIEDSKLLITYGI